MIGRRLLGVVVGAAILAVACGGPGSSFTAEGPCVADGRAPGTYPDLEAKLPGGLGERGASTTDSGRSCSVRALGTLTSHGIADLRYAGSTWTPEGGSNTAIAVFTTPPGQPRLEAGWIEEFYETGARATSKTENIEITRPALDDAGTVWRLDTLNDLQFQSVVVWPGTDLVHAVIVSTKVEPGGATRAQHDDQVRLAVHSAATLDQGTGSRGRRMPVLTSRP